MKAWIIQTVCGAALVSLALLGQSGPRPSAPSMVTIPAGSFEMGDHHGFVDPKHGSDEAPIHKVRLDAFQMGLNDVTTLEYAEFLNSAMALRLIEVRKGGIYLAGGSDLLCDTRESSRFSRIGWDGKKFSVPESKESHPMVCVRWRGAAVYCNWLSKQKGYPTCYNTNTWECDFNKSGFRLPTEAEWEYAARGGQQSPYFNYPWGNEADPARANVPESRNPFRQGAQPMTTPAGFFKANGYGLYDMAGNVWQWCNDLYERNYYAYSPAENPPGPAQGSPMPDGKTYRVMRGGSWYNGEFGHSRVSNRDPSYFRGPDPASGLNDPDGPWFHIGFRVVRPLDAESRALIEPTPAPRDARQDPARGGDGTRRGGDVRLVRNESGSFVLRSPVVSDHGALPKEFTGDGEGVTPPLEWSGAPSGTKSYALIMHHTDPKGEYVTYWLLYNIPANIQSLPKDVKGVGTLGIGSRGKRAAYTPPHSQGPGLKTYVLTMYALSAPPQIAAGTEVTNDILMAAIKNNILASADLSMTYTRPGGDQGQRAAREDRPPRPGGQGGAGGRVAEDNKTPASPNPGQTVGLFLSTAKASSGYTLLAPKHNTVTYLLDNQGCVVHQWKSQYEPGQSVYLKPNGNLLRTCMLRNRSFTGGGEGGRIEEYDWDGKLIWEFTYSNDKYQQHHDIAPLPNGNILMLVVEKKSEAESIATGWPAEMVLGRELYPDSIVEVQPAYPNGGKVVWEWRVWDHMIQDYDKAKANYGDVAAHPELIYLNASRNRPPSFWNHVNSIAYNAKLDQIVISARGSSEIWFIDHSTTRQESAGHKGGRHGKGGDLIYRWGNPAAYKRGSERDAQLNQQHDAHWIPDGYPGAGHVTIFNNGYNRGYSSIEEIAPPVDPNGRYVILPGKPYGPEKPAWHYEAKDRTDFFSSEISGAHRLPNGNTLICAGVIGHLFEVTPEGETVWQYVNPMVRGGILAQGELPGKDVRGHLYNAVFKAQRYAPDYPGLAGRNLTPGEPIELPASQKGNTGLDKKDASSDERPPGRRGPGGDGGPRRNP